MVECHPISANDQAELHQFGKRVVLGICVGHALYAGGIWKGGIFVADVEELKILDADFFRENLKILN